MRNIKKRYHCSFHGFIGTPGRKDHKGSNNLSIARLLDM
jgi:hypothetical protein